MTMRIILPALAALALAGCQSGGGNSADVPANAADANSAEAEAIGNAAEGGNVTAKVLAMSDRERNVVFIRAIMDAGLPCQSVKRSTRLADQDGKPLWRAECDGGQDQLITITPDGTANIVSRTDR